MTCYSEIERYTKAADQKRLAQSAAARSGTSGNTAPQTDPKFGISKFFRKEFSIGLGVEQMFHVKQ